MDKSSWWWFGSGMVSWGLGFLCKGIVITLPGLAFLFHYFFISRLSFMKWLRAQMKWVTLAFGALLVAINLKANPFLVTSPTQYSSSEYFLTQTLVIPFDYFRKFLVPANLNIDIWFPIVSGWTQPSHWVGFAVLGLMIGVGIFVLVTGLSTAWLVTMCRFPGRKLFEWLLLFPLAIPAYVIAYAYTDLFDYSGYVQTVLRGFPFCKRTQTAHVAMSAIYPTKTLPFLH